MPRSMTEEPKEPTIRFVENLEALTLCKAFSLVWINEIHIDKKYEKASCLNDLINHEKYHHRILWKRYYTRRKWKRILLILYNNVWDCFDVLYLELKWMCHRIIKACL